MNRFLLVLLALGVCLPGTLYADHRSGTNEGQGYSSDQIRQWWGDSRRTRDAINDLDDDRVDEIAIPVLFGITLDGLEDNFGDPRGGGTRLHEGLDMNAPEGAPIVTPTEAVVLRVGEGSSSGKYVYTANPGGETFVYMHLSEIAEGLRSGDELDEGDLIGLVGDTGNAAPGAYHLHFEMRDGGAQDPLPRITKEYDLEEKIEFLERALGDVDDREDFVEFIVATYLGELLTAEAAGIDLPRDIKDQLGNLDITGDVEDIDTTLRVGSSGDAVVALQRYLIQLNLGSAATRLSAAGATGYYGAITEAAVLEYQDWADLAETGVYDRATRDHVQEKTAVTRPTESDPAELETFSLSVIGELLRNELRLGSAGVEVQVLQLFLMIKQSGASATALTAAGATGYYGPITEAAMREYQASAGVSATGVYDAATRTYIREQE